MNVILHRHLLHGDSRWICTSISAFLFGVVLLIRRQNHLAGEVGFTPTLGRALMPAASIFGLLPYTSLNQGDQTLFERGL